LADGNAAQLRPSLCGDKDRPFFALREQSASGKFRTLPSNRMIRTSTR
jgi:hypothetical protein